MTATTPRLKTKYQDEIKKSLQDEFNYANPMLIPGLTKIVVNMGVGEAARDFRGLSPKQFDGNGNYTFGLTEQVMFHEIDQDKIDRVQIMETYPLSASKRWCLVEILEKAK